MRNKRGLLSLFRAKVSPKKKRAGREGEELARRFFESKGYKIIAHNYRTKLGEIDLICEKGRSLVFVEVRCRAGSDFGEPEESVRRDKIDRIRQTALHFLSEKGIYDKEIRFDLFCIKGKRFELIPNAF